MAATCSCVDPHGDVGFEERMLLWLPSYLREEAACLKTHPQKDSVEQQPSTYPHKLSAQAHIHLETNYIYGVAKQRTKSESNNGGPRMQAFFLDSGGRSSTGTGVFLPQTAGRSDQPSKKPACAPVLLPSRVVQALNLNVPALGLQISPRREAKTNSRDRGDGNNCLVKNRNTGKEASASSSAQCCVINCPDQSSLADQIFLPKEWTY